VSKLIDKLAGSQEQTIAHREKAERLLDTGTFQLEELAGGKSQATQALLELEQAVAKARHEGKLPRDE
jgi:hypothetical protein